MLVCCGLGYVYQGPPFRLGYRGLGEPLCWLAFGPFATAAALMALQPPTSLPAAVPWQVALSLGSGPALATTLVLFCSHFHQVEEDAAHGKRSPVVKLGTAKAAAVVPWLVAAGPAMAARAGAPVALHRATERDRLARCSAADSAVAGASPPAAAN